MPDSENSLTNFGFAKAILFGEHSVVYGHPAIVCGIGGGARTEILVPAHTSRFYFSGVDNHFDVGLEEDSSIGQAFRALFHALEIETPISLEIELSIPTGSGLGSSAAIGVSAARALTSYLSLDVKKIDTAVAAFEKVFHASPSGVDQAAAMYGGIFAYDKTNGISKIQNPDLHLVIANVGARAPTHEIVRDVAKEKKKDEAKFTAYLSEMGSISKAAIRALASGKVVEVGRLMTENHRLLKTLSVSSPRLDEACELAQENGALGAKLTGAGRGGCMIALVEAENKQVQKALRELGYWTHACQIPKTLEV